MIDIISILDTIKKNIIDFLDKNNLKYSDIALGEPLTMLDSVNGYEGLRYVRVDIITTYRNILKSIYDIWPEQRPYKEDLLKNAGPFSTVIAGGQPNRGVFSMEIRGGNPNELEVLNSQQRICSLKDFIEGARLPYSGFYKDLTVYNPTNPKESVTADFRNKTLKELENFYRKPIRNWILDRPVKLELIIIDERLIEPPNGMGMDMAKSIIKSHIFRYSNENIGVLDLTAATPLEFIKMLSDKDRILYPKHNKNKKKVTRKSDDLLNFHLKYDGEGDDKNIIEKHIAREPLTDYTWRLSLSHMVSNPIGDYENIDFSLLDISRKGNELWKVISNNEDHILLSLLSERHDDFINGDYKNQNRKFNRLKEEFEKLRSGNLDAYKNSFTHQNYKVLFAIFLIICKKEGFIAHYFAPKFANLVHTLNLSVSYGSYKKATEESKHKLDAKIYDYQKLTGKKGIIKKLKTDNEDVKSPFHEKLRGCDYLFLIKEIIKYINKDSQNTVKAYYDDYEQQPQLFN